MQSYVYFLFHWIYFGLLLEVELWLGLVLGKVRNDDLIVTITSQYIVAFSKKQTITQKCFILLCHFFKYAFLKFRVISFGLIGMSGLKKEQQTKRPK